MCGAALAGTLGANQAASRHSVALSLSMVDEGMAMDGVGVGWIESSISRVGLPLGGRGLSQVLIMS